MSRLLFNPRSYQPSQKLLDFVSKEKKISNHILFQSSGSTGVPKWVALSTDALETSAEAVVKHLRLNSKDVLGLALPDFHVGGYGLLERAKVAGAKLKRFTSRWEPHMFRTWLVDEQITSTSLVPAQVYDLVRAGLKSPALLKSVVVGGGVLPENLYGSARDLGWPLLISYGLTECASQVATAELSSLDVRVWPKAKILPHMQLVQVDHQKVSVKSPSLLSFYLREGQDKIELTDPKVDSAFLLPDRVEVEGFFLKVWGRWEQDYKILGEWVRWDYLKKKFSHLCVEKNLYLKYEIEIFPNERAGNLIAIICESFNQSAQELVKVFNNDVYPFERITHYYEGNLPRSELGKVLRLKINPICLKEISR